MVAPIVELNDEYFLLLSVSRATVIIYILVILFLKGHESRPYKADSSVAGPFFKVYLSKLERTK